MKRCSVLWIHSGQGRSGPACEDAPSGSDDAEQDNARSSEQKSPNLLLSVIDGC